MRRALLAVLTITLLAGCDPATMRTMARSAAPQMAASLRDPTQPKEERLNAANGAIQSWQLWGVYDESVMAALEHASMHDPDPSVRAAAKVAFETIEREHAKAPAPVVVVEAPATPVGTPAAPPGKALRAGSPRRDAWALVIGVEKYRDVPPPTGARSDATRFHELVTTSLGVPEDHVVVALDDRASRADLEKHLEWLEQNVQKGGRIYLYFAGHGAPEPASGTSYLLPYDADPKRLEKSALKLSDVLAQLGRTKAKETLVVLDACFSGTGGRSVLAEGIRPLVPVRKVEAGGGVAVFSAASADEVSGTVPGGTGGLFTARVVEAIGEGAADGDGDGAISLEELGRWVTPRVAREAKKDGRAQTPALSVGAGAGSAADFLIATGVGG